MKIFDIIINFLKSLFGKAGKQENPDGNCPDCEVKDICQTTDKSKKYAVIVGMESSKWGACSGSTKDSNTMLGLVSQYMDASSHIVKMNDKQGTVDAVRNALNSQIEKVPEDGLFVFCYSGHGGQYPSS